MQKFTGFGLGLRREHYETVVRESPAVDWFEIISENYMVPGGRPLHYLDRIRERYPLVMHGVSMSLGSTQRLNRRYLRDLRNLITRVEPAFVSDHLCWTGVDGLNLHDLLPLPYTGEALSHVASRIHEVQDQLRCRLLIENPSSYLAYRHSEMPEWEFLAALVRTTGCELLLDVNNVYVSSVNHGFSALEYLRGLPGSQIRQIHLAGHRRVGGLLVDTHDGPVCDAVWALYREAVRLFGAVPTMIERDGNIPELDVLLTELQRARAIVEPVTHVARAA